MTKEAGKCDTHPAPHEISLLSEEETVRRDEHTIAGKEKEQTAMGRKRKKSRADTVSICGVTTITNPTAAASADRAAALAVYIFCFYSPGGVIVITTHILCYVTFLQCFCFYFSCKISI